MNKFFNAFAARHIDSQDAAEYSDSNKKKAAKTLARLKSKSVVALLNASSVDVATMNKALYMNEKLVSFAAFAANVDNKLIANVDEAFRTAMLCARNNEKLFKSDIEATLLVDHEVSDERKHLVYKRASRIDAQAQVQQCIDMLLSLNILKSESKNTFSVNVNDAAKAMIDRLAIDMSNAA